jgi:osmotically-inducible protein OsmY
MRWGKQDFYQKNMKKIQAKLAECAEKQSMSIESLERLSNALHTAPAPTPEDDDAMGENNTSTTTTPLSDELIAAKEYKGENVGVKLGTNKKSKKRKAKHAVRKSTININNNGKELFVRAKGKQKPRYHVEF